MRKLKVIIVMPAYYAEKTLEKTVRGLPEVYEHLIVCDDASRDNTAKISKALGIETITHGVNLGYGGNQKTLYKKALSYNPEIIIMVHPDNQYNTSAITN